MDSVSSGRSELTAARFRLFPPDAVLHSICWLIALAAPVFFLFAVQYSGLIFPFWDHCEMIKYFAKIQDHTLAARDLLAPHNHSRPLVLRAIVLANGLLTQWDVGSEFVYLIGTVMLAFLAQALCLWRLCGTASRFPVLVALMAIFSFSPAGHNNHWWSFMLQLDLTHLLVVLAFLAVCFKPRAWTNNLIAAAACWLATYTLSNGLVAFLAVLLTVQIAKRPLLRFDRFTLFWTANFVTVVALYLPGLAETGGVKHFLKLLKFCAAYLGSPVASLFVFPYQNMFDIPLVTVRNAWVGVLLLVAAIGVLLLLRGKLAAGRPSALLFVCFSAFAIGSGLLTGWGRAEFDSYGVANANASRYTIYSTYLVYGLIYAASQLKMIELPDRLRTRTPFVFNSVALVACAIFVGFAIRSYAKSVVVYHDAHNFNQVLADAFLRDDPNTRKYIYPNGPVLEGMLMELKRLHIGPYRFIHPDGGDGIVLLAANKTVDQFGVNGIKEELPLGKILFSNPPSRFELPVSPAVKGVRFSFGILHNALVATPNLAGADFRLLLKRSSGEETALWSRRLQPVTNLLDRGEQTSEVEIHVADEERVVFETKAIGSPQGCWAYWQYVQVKR